HARGPHAGMAQLREWLGRLGAVAPAHWRVAAGVCALALVAIVGVAGSRQGWWPSPSSPPPTRPVAESLPTRPHTSAAPGSAANPNASPSARPSSTFLGGNPTDLRNWPWLAAVYDNTMNGYICGGVAIAARQILTAGHCVRGGPSTIEVEIGNNGQ